MKRERTLEQSAVAVSGAAAVARDRNVTAVDEFVQIVKDGGAGVVCTSMVDEDIRRFYERPWVMVASDGGINTRHPRGAGTFPRVPASSSGTQANRRAVARARLSNGIAEAVPHVRSARL